MLARLQYRWGRLRAGWDLSALLDGVDPQAPKPAQHLWLVRLVDWLRRTPPTATAPTAASDAAPLPVQRLRYLLDMLDRHPTYAERVAALLRQALRDNDASTLLAEHGFAPRSGFASELSDRLRLALLPANPDTHELGRLFALVFHTEGDAKWIEALDEVTLARCAQLIDAPSLQAPWQQAQLDAIELLASQVRAAGLSAQLRGRMDEALRAERPFHGLVHATLRLADALAAGEPTQLRQDALYLRGLLDRCQRAAASVLTHLEEHGVSVDVVFQVDQIRERCGRIEALLTTLVSPSPATDWRWLAAELVRAGHARRGWRKLFAHQYSLLARKVAERSAATGEHYITRTAAEYRDMLARALGGGAVIAGTTLVKFALAALGFTAFWGGFWAGVNYAGSFIAIHLLHWTVATKQPAMTAPALAAKLHGVDSDDAVLEGFVDEVAHLIRSQFAGIAGNLLAVVPVVLAAQGLAWWALGRPLISAKEAHHVLDTLRLLGPTPLYAAFTGVLLFVASLIGGWAENSFVWHRLDSAIAWNPRFVALLGAARAARWGRWWRANIAGLASNFSLGLLLGLVPAVATFFGLPLEVRHVTLATGQLAAAASTLGLEALRTPAFWWSFWWCVAAIPVIGALNLLVSFALAFRVALRSRGLAVKERGRIGAALRARLRQAPLSFLLPPKAGAG